MSDRPSTHQSLDRGLQTDSPPTRLKRPVIPQKQVRSLQTPGTPQAPQPIRQHPDTS